MDFCPGKSKSLSRCSLGLSLEVTRIEMVRLQVPIGQHPKAATQTRVEHPEKPLGNCFSKIGVDFASKVARFWGELGGQGVAISGPKT